MDLADEPALKRTADAASGAAQSAFLRLNRIQLILLATTAVASGWNPPDPVYQRVVGVAVFIMMVGAFAVSIALKIGHFDDVVLCHVSSARTD